MDTIYMNFKNSKICDSYRLLLNLADERNLKRSNKFNACQILACTIHGKNIKTSYKNNKFKISAPTWTENVNYLMDHIQYLMFKIIL